METYPEPNPKPPELVKMLLSLYEQKCMQEKIADSLAANSKNQAEIKLARALRHSCRIIAEDFAREAGYMLPQSREVRNLLNDFLQDAGQEEKKIIQKLL
jgi:hypothetical protein